MDAKGSLGSSVPPYLLRTRQHRCLLVLLGRARGRGVGWGAGRARGRCVLLGGGRECVCVLQNLNLLLQPGWGQGVTATCGRFCTPSPTQARLLVLAFLTPWRCFSSCPLAIGETAAQSSECTASKQHSPACQIPAPLAAYISVYFQPYVPLTYVYFYRKFYLSGETGKPVSLSEH